MYVAHSTKISIYGFTHWSSHYTAIVDASETPVVENELNFECTDCLGCSKSDRLDLNRADSRLFNVYKAVNIREYCDFATVL